MGDPQRGQGVQHRAGDGRAFDEVYGRYAGMVYGLALRLSGNPAEAEDLTQEVFLRIYRHLSGFRGGSSLKTWVYRVALNQCRSRFARFRPATQGLFEEGVEEAPQLRDPGRGPEDDALSHDTARRVSEALGHLPMVFREAVVLRDLEGLTPQLIAQLAEAGVHKRDDLADLAVDELTEITGQSMDEAKALIMKAREHWFTAAPAAHE